MVDLSSSSPPNATSPAPNAANQANIGEIEAATYRPAANDSQYQSERRSDNETARAAGKDQDDEDGSSNPLQKLVERE